MIFLQKILYTQVSYWEPEEDTDDGKSYTETILDNFGYDDSTDYHVQVFLKESAGAICDQYELSITVEE